MGGINCSQQPVPPPPTNQCAVRLNDVYDVPNSCGVEVIASNYCAAMSSAGEWSVVNPSSPNCSYNTCVPNQLLPDGTHCDNDSQKGCVAQGGGQKIACVRNSYHGDPVTCCFKNYACNPTDNNCFSDSTKQLTCDPNYQAIFGPGCQSTLLDYCGGNPIDSNWLNRWKLDPQAPQNCATAISESIFQEGINRCHVPFTLAPNCGGNTNPQVVYNGDGLIWAQDLVKEAVSNFTKNGFVLGSIPGTPTYHPFQDILYDQVCCPFAAVCEPALRDYCGTLSTDEVSRNPELAKWCGCHLNVLEYQKYVDEYDIPSLCTPICNRIGTVPQVGLNGLPTTCPVDVCIIDKITVNVLNSQVGGGIQFNQVCGDCGAGRCTCIVSQNEVDISNTIIGGSLIPVSENCGSLRCTRPNPGPTGPNTIAGPCDTTNPYQQFNTEMQTVQNNTINNRIFWSLVVIVVVLVVVFLLLLLYPKRN